MVGSIIPKTALDDNSMHPRGDDVGHLGSCDLLKIFCIDKQKKGVISLRIENYRKDDAIIFKEAILRRNENGSAWISAMLPPLEKLFTENVEFV